MTQPARQLLGESSKANPLPDEEIVRRVVAGDVALFEVLMRRHNRKLYRVVRSFRKGESETEVEDVMQQAYVSAYAHLADFRAESSFSTWLIRIGVHEALARARRQKRFFQGDGDDLMSRMRSKEKGPEQRAGDREVRRLLEQAIDELPETSRAVFILRDVEDLDTAETAACLGISSEAVKVRLHRAHRRLRERLYERAGAEAPDTFAFDDPRCDRVVDAVFAAIDRALAAGVPVTCARATPDPDTAVGASDGTSRCAVCGLPSHGRSGL